METRKIKAKALKKGMVFVTSDGQFTITSVKKDKITNSIHIVGIGNFASRQPDAIVTIKK